MSELEAMLDSYRALDLHKMRYELEVLSAIRDWAIKSLSLGYEVGDRVEIVVPYPQVQAKDGNNGWHAYREALAMGQSGVVREISFNVRRRKWQTLVAMDRCWSVVDDAFGKPLSRHWRGPEEECPEGFELYKESVKCFSFDAHWVAKV